LRFRELVGHFARSIRMFIAVAAFIWALDGAVAVNRWWVESDQAYLENLSAMTLGFLLFSLLASRSRLDLVGFLALSVAIYYVLDYEIGGPSKMYLTPFDPLLGVEPVFERGRWMGLLSAEYRWVIAAASSLLAASILTLSRILRLKNSGSKG